MKHLSIDMGAYNALLWRNMLGAIITGLLFAATYTSWPSPQNMRLHLKRSVVVALMAISFFWAIARMPLAEAIGLSFISPVIALYLAAVLLGERIGPHAIFASITGLIGVAIIIWGKFSGDYNDEALLGALAVLFSAVVFAYNLILARQQAQLAPPIEIGFFQNLLTCALFALAAPWFAQPIMITDLPMLSGAAILSVLSIMLLSWAYARAEAQILIPVEYTAFIWAALFGWYFFREAVTISTFVGTGLIMCGSIVAARAKSTVPVFEA